MDSIKKKFFFTFVHSTRILTILAIQNIFARYCLGAGDSNVQDEDDDEEEEEDVIDNDENGGFVNDDVDVGRSSRKSDLVSEGERKRFIIIPSNI